jgi:hypothetical protein
MRPFALLALWAVVSLAVLALTPPARADGYGGLPYNDVSGYYPPVKIVQQAVPVAVPFALYQFTAAPTTPPPAVLSPQVVAQQQAQAQAQAQAQQQASRQAQAALDSRLRAIEAALARLAQQSRTQPGPPVALAEDGPPPIPGHAAGEVTVRAASIEEGLAAGRVTRAAGLPNTPPADLTPRVAALLQSRCADCHSHPGRGKVDLFDAQGRYAPNVSLRAIWESVRDDTMPRSPQKLNKDEKELIRLAAGAPAAAD